MRGPECYKEYISHSTGISLNHLGTSGHNRDTFGPVSHVLS